MASRQPADAVERMLVEDVAMLAWKKRRLNRAQDGLQLRNLEVPRASAVESPPPE